MKDNKLGILLRRIRIDLDLTQKEFSKRIGIPQTQYNSYELNKNDPSLEKVFYMLDQLFINKINFFTILCSEKSLDTISKQELLSFLLEEQTS